MKRAALLVCLAGLSGCSTDSADSLSRDYRNLNNEAIDALMMCTSEARAVVARDKILKAYPDRLTALDKRMATWLQNTDDKLIVLDTLFSDSVATLLAELPINAKRLEYELQRLQNLAREVPGPVLTELARGAGLNGLKQQLMVAPGGNQFNPFGATGNKFQGLIVQFDTDKKWANQKPPNFGELREQLENRKKALALER
jgi:hypothetical protein